VEQQKDLKNFVLMAIISVALLITSGLFVLSSVAEGHFLVKQFVFAAVAGFVVFCVFKFLSLKAFKNFYWLFYIINIFLLVFLKFMGVSVLGSQRWIRLGPVSLQPSEFAKVFLIIFLAAWLSKFPIKNFKDVIKALFLIAIPSFLVLIQPDLGTTLVYFFICFVMLYWAGAKFIELLILVSPVIAAICSTFGSVVFSYQGNFINFQITNVLLIFLVIFFAFLYFSFQAWKSPLMSSIFFVLFGVNIFAVVFRELVWGLLKEYQQKRLTVFLDPYADPLGAGYQFIQSIYAIGSGGFFGKGFNAGDLTQGQFVPEQHTDFIFSAIGEEFGFFGTSFVLILFTSLLFSLVSIAKNTKNTFISLIAVGAFAMFFFHIFVNIGMNLSVMPITGVPLPFISYGGSAMLVNLFLLTLVLKSSIQEKTF
jgi:rod shape determining protein RodA